mmetsp:Transcript_14370/g.26127  ORF Transcript_14370/g.26127 Transcript_14370/m.26127 type:complete len:82 (-) Transcript_14370:361-606(-)
MCSLPLSTPISTMPRESPFSSKTLFMFHVYLPGGIQKSIKNPSFYRSPDDQNGTLLNVSSRLSPSLSTLIFLSEKGTFLQS